METDVVPAPPPGFEIETPEASIPKPPAGYELEQTTPIASPSIPPPPAGFEIESSPAPVAPAPRAQSPALDAWINGTAPATADIVRPQSTTSAPPPPPAPLSEPFFPNAPIVPPRTFASTPTESPAVENVSPLSEQIAGLFTKQIADIEKTTGRPVPQEQKVMIAEDIRNQIIARHNQQSTIDQQRKRDVTQEEIAGATVPTAGLPADVGSHLSRGMMLGARLYGGATQYLAGAGEAAGLLPPNSAMRRHGEAVSQKVEQISEQYLPVEPFSWRKPSTWLGGAVEQAPQLAASMGVGLAARAASGAIGAGTKLASWIGVGSSMGFVGVQEGSDLYASTAAEMRRLNGGMPLTPEQNNRVLVAATAVGVANAILEYVPADTFIGGDAGKYAIKQRIIRGLLSEGLTEHTQGMTGRLGEKIAAKTGKGPGGSVTAGDVEAAFVDAFQDALIGALTGGGLAALTPQEIRYRFEDAMVQRGHDRKEVAAFLDRHIAKPQTGPQATPAAPTVPPQGPPPQVPPPPPGFEIEPEGPLGGQPTTPAEPTKAEESQPTQAKPPAPPPGFEIEQEQPEEPAPEPVDRETLKKQLTEAGISEADADAMLDAQEQKGESNAPAEEVQGQQTTETVEPQPESSPRPAEATPAAEPSVTQAETSPQRDAASSDKQPWEMTRAEYLDKYGQVPNGFDANDPRAIKTEGARILRLPDGSVVTTGEHGKAVFDALAEGKPVPPEVLADYPDLKAPDSSPRPVGIPSLPEPKGIKPQYDPQDLRRAMNAIPGRVGNEYVLPGTEGYVAEEQENERVAGLLRKEEPNATPEQLRAAAVTIRQAVPRALEKMRKAWEEWKAGEGVPFKDYINENPEDFNSEMWDIISDSNLDWPHGDEMPGDAKTLAAILQGALPKYFNTEAADKLADSLSPPAAGASPPAPAAPVGKRTLAVGDRIPWKNSPFADEKVREIEIVKLTPKVATVRWVGGKELSNIPREAVEARLAEQQQQKPAATGGKPAAPPAAPKTHRPIKQIEADLKKARETLDFKYDTGIPEAIKKADESVKHFERELAEARAAQPKPPGDLIVKDIRTGNTTVIPPKPAQAPQAPDTSGLSPALQAMLNSPPGTTNVTVGNSGTTITPPAAPAFGETNKVFTKDAFEAAKAKLKAKLGGSQVNAGFDPEIVTLAAQVAGFYVEGGVRKFAEFARKAVAEFGPSIKPYLKMAWNGVRDYPGMEAAAAEMDDISSLKPQDLDAIIEQESSNEAANQTGKRDGTGDREPSAVPGGGGSSAGSGAAGLGGDVSEGNAPEVSAGSNQPGGEPQGPTAETGNAGTGSGRTGQRPRNPKPAPGKQPTGTDSGTNRPGGEGTRTLQQEIAERRADLPDADRNHRITDSDVLIAGGPSAKADANIEAIRLYKKLVEENRNPTPQEKQVLAKYVGWGDTALAPLFDRFKPQRIADAEKYGSTLDSEDANWNKKFGRRAAILKELLTEDEWDNAARSTMNAHYTAREIITRGLWAIAQRLGFKGGNVLESSAGIGHIIGLIPDEMEGKSQWTAVEKDSLSSGMLKKLYPEATVYRMGFEDAPIENNSFQLVIGNPPFHQNGPIDKRYPSFSLHNYMLARAIDAAEPGQMLVQIVSTSTMDATASTRFREWAQERVDLVGAIRLPNDTFEKNAGTQVTTDILVLRKRDQGAFDKGQRWLETRQIPVKPPTKWDKEELGDPPTEATINEYFVEHPEMMLGEMGLEGTMRGKAEQALVKRPDQDTLALLDAAVLKLPANITKFDPLAKLTIARETAGEANAGTKEFSFHEKDGKIWQVEKGQFVAPAWRGNQAAAHMAKSLIAMRGRLVELIDQQLDPDVDEKAMEANRKALHSLYDAFVARHGFINDNTVRRIFGEDPEYPLLASLEYLNDRIIETKGKGGKIARKIETDVKKGDILSKRTQYPPTPPTKADNPADAIAISESWLGHLDLDYVAKLLNVSKLEAGQKLLESGDAYRDPTSGLIVSKEEYLSGDVRAKLKQAEEAAKNDPALARNVESLRAVIPADKPIGKIQISLGSTWVPTEVYQEWFDHLFGDQNAGKVSYVAETGQLVVRWSTWVLNDAKNKRTLAAGGIPATEIIGDSLAQRQATAYDRWEDEDGKHQKVNPKRTEAARAQQQKLESMWESWAKGSKHAPQLATIFNEHFNGTVDRQFTLPPFKYFPGQSPTYFEARPHQKRAVMRGVRESYLLAHEVGLGKTMAFLITAMEWRRLGLAKKVMLVCLNANVNQITETAKRMYPNARILAPNKNDFQSQNRRRLLSRIATGDYDLVVLAQSQFNQVQDDPARVSAWVKAEIKRFIETLTPKEQVELQKKGWNKDPKVKAIEARIESLRDFLTELQSRKVDTTIPFEKLGIDGLIVDESHFYKKVYFPTQMERVSGLDTSFSQRGISLLMKMRWVQQQTHGRNTILSTGTPVTNTLAESWNVMRLVRPDLLKQWGILEFDDFAGTFARAGSFSEMDAVGRWREKIRFAQFRNTRQLSRMFRQIADVIFGDDIPEIERPMLQGGKEHDITLEPGPILDGIIKSQLKRYEEWEKLDGAEKRELSYVPIVIETEAKKAALDVRMIDPSLPKDKNSKIDAVADEVARIWESTTDVRGAQVIFTELFQSHDPKKKEHKGKRYFNVFEAIKEELIKRGIPAEQIAIAKEVEGNSKIQQAARLKLFNDINAGNVRVVMGTTAGLGVGVNIQERLVAAHHLMAPYRPADIEQRNGRIVRQGNLFGETKADTWSEFEKYGGIRILRYGFTKGFDAGSYGRLARKRRMIREFVGGTLKEDTVEDIDDKQAMSYEQAAAAYSGDPLTQKRFELMKDISRLKNIRSSHFDELANARSRKESAEQSIVRDLELIEKMKGYIEAHPEIKTPDRFAGLTIDGTTYDAADEAAKALGESYFAKALTRAEGLLKKMREGDKDNRERHYDIHLGRIRYGTFDVDLSAWGWFAPEYESLEDAPQVQYRIAHPVIEGAPYHHSYKTPGGLIRGVQDAVESMGGIIPNYEDSVSSTRKEIAELDIALAKTFEEQDDLDRMQAELVEVMRQLSGSAKDVDEPTAAELNDFSANLEFVGGVSAKPDGIRQLIDDIPPDLYRKFLKWLDSQSLVNRESAALVKEALAKLEARAQAIENLPLDQWESEGGPPVDQQDAQDEDTDDETDEEAQPSTIRRSGARPSGAPQTDAQRTERFSATARRLSPGARIETTAEGFIVRHANGHVDEILWADQDELLARLSDAAWSKSAAAHFGGETFTTAAGDSFVVPESPEEVASLPADKKAAIKADSRIGGMYSRGMILLDRVYADDDALAEEMWHSVYKRLLTLEERRTIDRHFGNDENAFVARNSRITNILAHRVMLLFTRGEIYQRQNEAAGWLAKLKGEDDTRASLTRPDNRQNHVMLVTIGAAKHTGPRMRYKTWAEAMRKQFPAVEDKALVFAWRDVRRFKAWDKEQRADWIGRQVQTGAQEAYETAGGVTSEATVNEVEALREQMKEAARKAGWKSAVGEGLAVRKNLTRIIQETLPPAARHPLMLAVAKAQTFRDVRIAIERLRSVLGTYDAKQAMKQLEGFIGRISLATPKPPKPASDINKSKELSEADQAAALGAKLVEALAVPWEQVDRTTLEQDLREQFDEIVKDAKKAKAALKAAKTIDDKYNAVASFRELTNRVREVLAEQIARTQARVVDRKYTRDALVEAAVKLIEPQKQTDEPLANRPPKDKSLIRRLLGRMSASVETLMHLLDGRNSVVTKATIDAIRDAQAGYHGEEKAWHEHIVPALAAAGLPEGSKKLDDFINKNVSIRLPNAGMVELTRNQMVGLVAASEDPDTQRVILKGARWTFRSNPLAKSHRLTMEDFGKLRRLLTDGEYGLIEAFRRHNEARISKPLFDASINLRGWAPDFVKRYFPRKRNLQQDESRSEPKGWRGQIGYAIEEITHLQKRADDVRRPLVVPEFIQDSYSYIENVAKVIHLADPVRTAAMLWDHPDVKAAINRQLGPSFNARMWQFLEDTMLVRLTAPATMVEKAVGAITHNVSRAYLQANISPMLKNIFGGTPMLLMEFDMRDLAPAMAGMFGRKAFRRMVENSSIAWARYHGGLYGQYSPVSGRHVETAAQLTAGQALRAGRIGAFFDALPFMAKADSIPLRAAFLAAEHEIRRTRPTLEGEKFDAAVAKRFHEVLYRTQNGTSSTEISGLGSSSRRNRILSPLLMFTSDSNKKYNALLRMRNASAGKKLKTVMSLALSNLATAAVTTGIAGGLLALGAYLRGREPDEKEKEKLYSKAGWDIVRNLVGMVYGGNALLDLMRTTLQRHGDVDLSSIPEQAFEDLINRMVRLYWSIERYSVSEADTPAAKKAYDSMLSRGMDMLESVLVTGGVPAQPLLRQGRQVYQAATATPDDPRAVAKREQARKTLEQRAKLPGNIQSLLTEKNRLDNIGVKNLTAEERTRRAKLLEIERRYEAYQKATARGDERAAANLVDQMVTLAGRL